MSSYPCFVLFCFCLFFQVYFGMPAVLMRLRPHSYHSVLQRLKNMLYWSNIKFSNRVGQEDFFLLLLLIIPIFDLHYKHGAMSQSERNKYKHFVSTQVIFTVCNRYSSACSQIFMGKKVKSDSWQLSQF